MHMKKSLEVAFILTLACDTLCDVNHTFSSQLDQVKCTPRAERAGVSGGAARTGGGGVKFHPLRSWGPFLICAI